MIWVLYPLFILLVLILVLILVLRGLRQMDTRADTAAWSALVVRAHRPPETYDPAMVASLPEPARRYFNFMIQPGAALRTSIALTMTGELGLGPKDNPGYRPMHARQILSPPYGFVWTVRTGSLAGSDGLTPTSSWTRFWLFGFIPIVRASGPDHTRAAFGRVIAEAAAWSPACLLPSDQVKWEPISDDTARATVDFGGRTQSVDITVDKSGAPIKTVIQRWTNANPDKVFRPQPFGGYLSEFTLFEGFQIATRVEVGNHFGTDGYYPFFKANITDVHFPTNNDHEPR